MLASRAITGHKVSLPGGFIACLFFSFLFGLIMRAPIVLAIDAFIAKSLLDLEFNIHLSSLIQFLTLHCVAVESWYLREFALIDIDI